LVIRHSDVNEVSRKATGKREKKKKEESKKSEAVTSFLNTYPPQHSALRRGEKGKREKRCSA